MQYDILMFAMSYFEYWTEKGIVNRNYHVLRKLAREEGRKIFLVEFLPFSFWRAVRRYRRDILSPKNGTILHRTATSILYRPTKRLPGQRADIVVYATVRTLLGEQSMYLEIAKLLAQEKFKSQLLLWSYYPLTTGYFDFFKNALRVFDAVDDWREHGAYGGYRTRLTKNYQHIAAVCDHVFTVSQKLLELFSGSCDVHWIRNGVDARHFAPRADRAIPPELAALPTPRIGYAGILEDRFDWDLLIALASSHPQWSFALLGWQWHEPPPVPKNVFLLGRKNYHDIPAYLAGLDVCIIPHKDSAFTASMNPLKLYEYLAAGKPVVATPVAGVEAFADFVFTARTLPEWSAALEKALTLNTPDAISKRIQRMQQEDWDNRFHDMVTLLGI